MAIRFIQTIFKDMSDIKTENLFGRFECIAMSRMWTLKELRSLPSYKFDEQYVIQVAGEGKSSRICTIWDYNFVLMREKNGNIVLSISYIGQKGETETIPVEYVNIKRPNQENVLKVIEDWTTFYSKSKEYMKSSLTELLSKKIPEYSDHSLVWGRKVWFVRDDDISLPHCMIVKHESKINWYKLVLNPGGFTDYYYPGKDEVMKRIEVSFKYNSITGNWKKAISRSISECIEQVIYEKT